jgi:hypothetical protein
VLLGLPGTQGHGSLGQAPSRDNLLVLYLDDQARAEQVAARLAALGHPRVEAENPYWTDNGAITVEDPDHWRVAPRLRLIQRDGCILLNSALARRPGIHPLTG